MSGMATSKPVAGRANSSRYDVQASYDALFFEKSEATIEQSSKYNSLAFEDFDVRQRLRLFTPFPSRRPSSLTTNV